MRLAVALVALLCFAVWVACTFPDPFDGGLQQRGGANHWRRTAAGWERTDSWQTSSRRGPPVPHPALVALWQVLVVATIGVAATPRKAIGDRAREGRFRCEVGRGHVG